MTPTATNPVLPGFYPDPSVCRVDGDDGTWYYLVNSSFEYLPGLPIHRSRDLVHWELVGHGVHRPGQLDLSSVADSQGLFAPTIRHDGQRFLIVCTLVGSAERGGNFVITATDAAGPWSDPVWWDENGIDPSLFFDTDGRVWAQGTRPAPEPEWDQQTEVWVREVDPATLRLVGEEHVVWSGAVRGAVWAESPHLYRRGDHVYLVASEGGTSFHHAVSVARATSPTGPFEGCKSNPVLTHRHLGRNHPVVNVGHVDLVEDPRGNWWGLLLATRPVDGVDVLGRETFLVPVVWEDDWPVFAPGHGVVPTHPSRPRPSRGSGRLPGPGVEPVLSVRTFPTDLGEIADDQMVVCAGPGLDAARPSYVGRRLTALPATVTVTVDDLPFTASAGLALRYDSAVWGEVLVQRTPEGTRLSMLSSDGAGLRLLSEQIVDGPARGVLGLDVDGLVAHAHWTPEDGPRHDLGTVSLAAMGSVVSGGFVGVTYGLHCVGSGDVVARDLGMARRRRPAVAGPAPVLSSGVGA